uniref:VWFD domain-containing protein n=1 Tax=Eptatretus burgeri TaxID=7764 RepID=A0A8C4NJR3_EPTBU
MMGRWKKNTSNVHPIPARHNVPTGLAPSTNVTDDGCCTYTYCDCVCMGWGDPHFSTFDGTYYSHMGNCTYVLVEERYIELDFAVYVTNYNCGRDVACPRSIIVVYKSKEVNVTVPDKNDLAVKLVTVNDRVVSLPYYDLDLFVEKYYVDVIVTVPHLNATVYFDGITFAIYLPHEYFFNNTQGQCGTCTQNKTDDCLLRNGSVVEDCNALGPDWVTNKTDHCDEHLPKPIPDCDDSKMCDIVYDAVFYPCLNIIDSSTFYNTCKYDACYSNHTACSSLKVLADSCNAIGFCIDWRHLTKGECDYECNEERVYLPCGNDSQYCYNKVLRLWKSYTIKNMNTPQEGCYCPSGTIPLNPEYPDFCTDNCTCEMVTPQHFTTIMHTFKSTNKSHYNNAQLLISPTNLTKI